MAAAQGGYNFKVVLLGEGCVGKTSCVLRYVEDKFNDKHITTLQVSPTINTLQFTSEQTHYNFTSDSNILKFRNSFRY